MKTPLKWLKQYVDIPVGVEEFASRMIMCGFEVEGIEDPGAAISGVVVGRINKLQKHPNADKLHICAMDVGGGRPLQVVTGATNVYEGALVPVATIGAKLHGGLEIKHSTLRGVDSEGMLCSGGELGIDDAWYPGAGVDGILILREDYAPGTDVKGIMGLDEPTIDFKITANRAADCMSMVGLAREASVVLGTKLREPVVDYFEKGGLISDYLSVLDRDYTLCPRYMARVIRDVKIADSPLWMRQALAAAGVRPINNIVDISNYVMLEMGQPMHAFDYRNLRGGQIIIRPAEEAEKLLTLDEKERTLTNNMLVIADGEGPVALAGIMGGEHSGIYNDTTTVVFESANFEWRSNRVTSRVLGMRTESSSRYEKSLPVYLAEAALNRAMALIQELGAGEIVEGVIDCHESLPQPKAITVSAKRICGLLGQDIDTVEIIKILEKLGFGVACNGDNLTIAVPLWRQDVESYADIAEEVQRIYGYDTIPSVPPPGEALQGRRTRRQEEILKLKGLLAGMGLNEALSYSFIAPAALDKLGLTPGDALRDAVRLINPIGEEYSLMRTTLAPSMLRSIATNLNRKNVGVRLFELSRTFRPNIMATLKNTDGSLSLSEPCLEKETLCIGIAEQGMEYFDLKGIVEAVFERFGIAGIEYKPGAACYYHPGRSATCMLNGVCAATLGEMHPDVAAAFDIDQKVYLAEMDIESLLANARHDNAIKPLPRFPAISRDLAVSVDRLCPVGDMLCVIRKAGGSLLESVELFDIYEGKQAGEGRKSVAFTLVFRSADHTLVDDEAGDCFDAIVQALNLTFSAEMRK